MPVRKTLNDGSVPVKIWTDDIEAEAERQVRQLASLPFVFKHVAVMPDVHAGRGSAIGTVTASATCIIPAAVGVDIGCGMAAVLTPFLDSHLDARLPALRSAIESAVPVGSHMHRRPLAVSSIWEGWGEFERLTPEVHDLQKRAACQHGTLGGGNHFIEICLDPQGRVWILLHSGSRHIGKTLADVHIDIAEEEMLQHGIRLPHGDLSYLRLGTRSCAQYLHDVLWAQAYARINRDIMLGLLSRELARIINDGEPFEPLRVVNCHHNYVAQEQHYGREVWVTRKGAIRAAEGDEGIIPGSMGARSYIVRGKGNPESFHSASHGAGRRMSRTRAREVFTEKDLELQTRGVECRKDRGVIDEIPGAYKDIDAVLRNESDLVEPVEVLKQVICVKG
ncbi:MAG: RtcB family protein [Bacteroidetes bacterium]|jgi:tRNA-splicing ligase RtcB|nr:RtcB family protein [Bacteroidota bacterium]